MTAKIPERHGGSVFSPEIVDALKTELERLGATTLPDGGELGEILERSFDRPANEDVWLCSPIPTRESPPEGCVWVTPTRIRLKRYSPSASPSPYTYVELIEYGGGHYGMALQCTQPPRLIADSEAFCKMLDYAETIWRQEGRLP